MKNKLKYITLLCWLFAVAIHTEKATAASANLNQARNGSDASPVSPVNWVNGNLSGTQAHYLEGMSVPYQCIMTGLTVGVKVNIVIGYDIKHSSRHAFDYLTHYNYILPHNFLFHSAPETVNPLIGTGLAAGTTFTTYPIPVPSSVGSPVLGQPGISFNAVPAAKRLMTLFNGTIDTIYYVVQGNLTATQSETQVRVVFTPSAPTAVLAWGGHIGSRGDWGYTGTTPNSAGSISGSPFHMRLKSWSYGTLGSQDRSLSGAAVAPARVTLPVEMTDFHAHAHEEINLVEWTTTSEVHNSHFILERSSSLSNFHPLATIQGAGNSNTTKNYSWTDEQPLNGISYYRLIQTDFDGTQKIFGPVSVQRDNIPLALTVVAAYPNPFSDNLILTYFSPAKTETSIEIFNALGKQIWYEMIPADAGINHFSFKDKTLPQGMYFITLTQPQYEPVSARIIRK